MKKKNWKDKNEKNAKLQERKIYLSLLKIIILPSFPFPSQTSLPNIPFGIIRLSACNYEVCYVLSGDNLAKIWFHLAAAWNILINPFNSYQINQHWIFFFPGISEVDSFVQKFPKQIVVDDLSTWRSC